MKSKRFLIIRFKGIIYRIVLLRGEKSSKKTNIFNFAFFITIGTKTIDFLNVNFF